MRKNTLLLVGILLLQVAAAKAQFCNTVKGTVLYYKTFDSEDDESKMDSTLVMDVKDEKNELTVKYKESGDKSSKPENDSLIIKLVYDKSHITRIMYLDAKEENERMRQVMSSYYPDEKKAEATKDYQAFQKRIRAEGEICIPLRTNMKKGDEIPACQYVHKIGLTKMSVSLSDGKCEGFESVQTLAGKFHCLKVSYVIKSKMMLISETDCITGWYAEGVGLVKEEVTTKRGKVKSSSQLVSIKRPK